MTLSVIGAGFGRTGTMSLKAALDQLGFGPCCHGSEERHFAQGSDFWRRVFNGEPVDWDQYFEGYRSTVDSPSCKFYLDIARHYASAKVILTVREPDAWFESYGDTLLPLSTNRDGQRLFTFLFGCEWDDRDGIIAAYESHNTQVQRSIPADRLLVYDVKQSWNPLCEFLDVPVPDKPFPHSNTRAEFPLVLDKLLNRRAVL